MMDFLVGLVGAFGALAEWLSSADLGMHPADWRQAATSWVTVKSQNGDVLNILGMVGIALLTIFIPIAIDIFRDEKGVIPGLRKGVFLNYIIESHLFLWHLACIYVPLFLWGFFSFHPIIQFFLFGLWCYGIYRIVRILQKSYRWLTEGVQKTRMDYFQQLVGSENLKEIEESWGSLWTVKVIDAPNEVKLLGVFSQTIDALLSGSGENIKIASQLMRGFGKFLDNRSITSLVSGVFPKVLEWHFRFWENRGDWRKKDADKRSLYDEFFCTLCSLKEKIEYMLLGVAGKDTVASFFNAVNAHIELCGPRIKNGENYIGQLLSQFFHAFFKNVVEKTHGVDGRGLWDIFPPKWKVSVENLSIPGNFIPRVLAKRFLEWAPGKEGGLVVHDSVLFATFIKIFPNVCPVAWALTLNFLLQKEDLKLAIEYPLTFVTAARSKEMGEDGANNEAQKESIELALLCYGCKFTEKKLEVYVRQLVELKCCYDGTFRTSQEQNRQSYLDIFKAMQAELARRAKTAGE